VGVATKMSRSLITLSHRLTLYWSDLAAYRITAVSRIPGNGGFREVIQGHEGPAT
jgi:hypothetical protein